MRKLTSNKAELFILWEVTKMIGDYIGFDPTNLIISNPNEDGYTLVSGDDFSRDWENFGSDNNKITPNDGNQIITDDNIDVTINNFHPSRDNVIVVEIRDIAEGYSIFLRVQSGSTYGTVELNSTGTFHLTSVPGGNNNFNQINWFVGNSSNVEPPTIEEPTPEPTPKEPIPEPTPEEPAIEEQTPEVTPENTPIEPTPEPTPEEPTFEEQTPEPTPEATPEETPIEPTTEIVDLDEADPPIAEVADFEQLEIIDLADIETPLTAFEPQEELVELEDLETPLANLVVEEKPPQQDEYITLTEVEVPLSYMPNTSVGSVAIVATFGLLISVFLAAVAGRYIRKFKNQPDNTSIK